MQPIRHNKAMLIRRIAAALFVFLALLACLAAFGNAAGIDHTVESSIRFDAQFKVAADAIERFRQSHGDRLPNADEWDAILYAADLESNEVMVAQPGFDECDRDNKRYSRLSRSDYVLITWRGEWWECYAPTKNMSTLSVQPGAYTMFGAVWRDTFVLLVFAVSCLLVAFKLAVRRKTAEGLRD